MKLPLFSIGTAVLSSLVLVTNAFANFSIESLNSPFTIDFSSFNGSGFSSNPGAGQLDSDFWAVDGFSDGSLDFGGTATDGDFARGSNTDAVGTGGIWAFDVGDGNNTLGIQPTSSDWAPGSFTLRLQNNTGTTLNSLLISYSIYVYNDQNRADSFNFSYSFDNITYTDVGILNFESPEAPNDSPSWVETEMETTITGLSVADGSSYYFRWSGDNFSGTGSRDQLGLDNISVSAVPEPEYFGLICGLIMLFLVRKRVFSLKSD